MIHDVLNLSVPEVRRAEGDEPERGADKLQQLDR
jgi:hypothetical protein